MGSDRLASFRQATDPGVVGAGVYWLDTTTEPYFLKRRNEANDDWVSIGGGEDYVPSHDHSHDDLDDIGALGHDSIDAHILASSAHGVSGAIVGTTSTQTLAGKTLTTPIIGSMVNANHDHIAGAGGGVIPHANLSGIGTNTHAQIDSALDLKAPLASPIFTGVVTLPVGLTGVLRADTGAVSTDTDVTDLVTAASATAQGKVELANVAETTAGSDAVRAVTPQSLMLVSSLAAATWFLDEDNMASDSATKTASQQSIKAYADTKQAADSDLATIAGLTATTDNFIQSAASAWASRTPAQAKATLALVKGDVGLGNVDNTSDAAKPVSTATQTALDLKQAADADLATIAGLTATTDNFIQSAASAWASRTPAQAKTTLALVKGDVGLGNVDNTSDASKPVSTATQTALDLKSATTHHHDTVYSQNRESGILTPPGFQAASVATVTALGTGVIAARYIGQAPFDPASIIANFSVETLASGITWAEIGIAIGTPVNGAGTTLTRVVYENVAGIFNTTGQKTRTLTGTMNGGEHLWILWGSSATQPFQLAGGIGQPAAQGSLMFCVTRLSTMAANTAFTATGLAARDAWLTYQFV